MKSRKLLLWFYKLSWRKIAGFSGLALIIAIIPLALNAANSPTRTRSEAALITRPQPVTAEFVTPKGPPQIYLVDHFFGKAGDAVLVHGANLGGLSDKTSVSLSGQVIPDENIVTWTSDYIEFKLPANIRSGRASVNILGQTAAWPGTFWVVDETTMAELRLVKSSDTRAGLQAKNIDGTNGLLVWLLLFQGEGEVNIVPAAGVQFQSQTQILPLGKIYELKLNFTPAGEWTQLATITKKPAQRLGIARAESETNLPIKVHPLYVSF